MSRTFRRTGAKGSYNSPWHRRYLNNDDWIPYRYRDRGLTVEQARAKMKARFYGDNASGQYTPPSWYVRLCFTRIERRVDNRLLREALVHDELEGLSFAPRRQCAAWSWW